MRIGIDARFYGTLGKGLGRYVSELIAQLEAQDHDNDYVVFLRKENFADYVPTNPRFCKVIANVAWYGLAEQFVLPFILLRERLDLVHFPHFNVPLFYPRQYIVTIHDLILLSHPSTRATRLGPIWFRLKFLGYRIVVAAALRRAQAVITVSDYTRQEIRRYFPFMMKRNITVTYEACGTPFRETPTRSSGPRVRLPKPYFLYVGNAYPHKNLNRLIDAFRNFRKDGHADYHLVLVGGADYFYNQLQYEAHHGQDEDNIIFFGHASDDELAAIYDGALAYVFPSLCEGFGLPPLEAMSRGVPVAAACVSCLPEVLGEAAHYFDPQDTASITQALRYLADNPEIRESLKSSGREQAKRYDWQTLGTKTLDCYRGAQHISNHVSSRP